MIYELISNEDWNNLPEDPDLKFVEIDRICRRNLTGMINEQTDGYLDEMVPLQYITTLANAAIELGIPDVEYPHDEDQPTRKISSFMLAVSGAVTRIRLRTSGRAAPYSVRLGIGTKARIQLKIQQLRATIEEAHMPESKREALLGKLDELAVELDQTRLSFARTMKILAAISVGVCAGTSFLADAPQAITTITRLIGADKEIEEAEAKRLGREPEPKLLTSPQTTDQTQRAADASSTYEDLDDEIPF